MLPVQARRLTFQAARPNCLVATATHMYHVTGNVFAMYAHARSLEYV